MCFQKSTFLKSVLKIYKLFIPGKNFNKFLIMALSILILLNNICIASCVCPKLCECKWKYGKESVLCLNTNMSNLPNDIDTGTQILDLTGNLIFHLRNDIFITIKLLNLQKVILVNGRLKIIDQYAFRGLKNLIDLDLSNNLLITIPSYIFYHTPELREIRLNENPIEKIPNNAFIGLSKLTRIELSNCNISYIASKSFRGIEHSLEWLKLDGNNLIQIIPESFTILKNIHDFELANNFWNCSCYLRPLRLWMIREKIAYNVVPICQTPLRLFNKTWDKINLYDFDCVPNIIKTQTTMYGIIGKAVTLTCSIQENVKANIHWMSKDRLIASLSNNMSDSLDNKGINSTMISQGRKYFSVNLIRGTSNLSISVLEQRDAGVYTCLAENKAGRAEIHITLIVSQKEFYTSFKPNLSLLGLILVTILFVLFFLITFWKISIKIKRKHDVVWNNIPSAYNNYEKMEMDINISLSNNVKWCPTNAQKLRETVDDKELQVSIQNSIQLNNTKNIADRLTNFKDLCTPWSTTSSTNNSTYDSSTNKGNTQLDLNQSSAEYIPDLEQIHTYKFINKTFTLPRSSKSFIQNSFNAYNSRSQLLPYNTNLDNEKTSWEDNFKHSSIRRFSAESPPEYKAKTKYFNGRHSISALNCSKIEKENYGSCEIIGRTCNSLNFSSSPSVDITSTKYLSKNQETPILNFSSFIEQSNVDIGHASAEILSHFHAIQLERFLEEYHSLQEQLCKMKETCEEICKSRLTWENNETVTKISCRDDMIHGTFSEKKFERKSSKDSNVSSYENLILTKLNTSTNHSS